MPKLWNDTIQAHRQQVRAAIMDSAWALAAERGLSAVTMSEVAEKAGIGRATLYKYFSDPEAILAAWHERQITRHLTVLTEARDAQADPERRLYAVLTGYARIQHHRGEHESVTAQGGELMALLHTDETVTAAQARLRAVLQDVLSEAAAAGVVRVDASVEELAGYCLFALTAAATLATSAEVERLVDITVTGLRP